VGNCGESGQRAVHDPPGPASLYNLHMRTLAHPRALARLPVRALLAQWPLALVDDVEGIHQSRVASRRLRELVPVLAGAADARGALSLRRGLRAVTRLLGRSRELDVALGTLAAIESRTPGHASAVAAVRAHVVREREQAGRDLRARVGRVDVHDLAAGTLALARRSESPAAIRACARRVAVRLGRRAAELELAVVDAGLIFAPGPLHGVRIALKKFRYALELAERLGRFRLGGAMRALKRMQNLLGDLHDLQVLGGLARDVMSQSPASQRPEFEALVTSIDDHVRGLHSQFLAERDNMVGLLARATGVRRTLRDLPAPHTAAPPPPSPRRRASNREGR
jgi:CHAD domain-containing protein